MKNVSIKVPAVALLTALTAVGCSNAPPSTDLIDRVPVHRVGDAGERLPPQQLSEQVLLLPAATPLPLRLVARGNVFEQPEYQAGTEVVLKQPVYLYRHWVSFDGRHWQNGDELFESRFSFGIDNVDGTVQLAFDRR